MDTAAAWDGGWCDVIGLCAPGQADLQRAKPLAGDRSEWSDHSDGEGDICQEMEQRREIQGRFEEGYVVH